LAISLGSLCAAVAAAITCHVVPAKYTAVAGLNVHPDDRKTEADQIKSSHVLETVLKNPQVAEILVKSQVSDSLRWLREEIQVDSSGKTHILRISVSGESPTDVAIVVNAVIDAYLHQLDNRTRGRLQELLAQWSERYKEAEEALRRQDERLHRQKHNLGKDPKVLGRDLQVTLEHYGDLQQELLKVQTSRMTTPRNKLTEIAELRSKEQVLKKLVESDADHLNKFYPRLSEVEATQVEADRLRADIDHNRKECTSRRAELLSWSPRVSLNHAAEIHQTRDRKRQIKAVAVAALATLGAVLLGISWWEWSARRIYGVVEVGQDLRMTLLGILPAGPDRARHLLADANTAAPSGGGKLSGYVDAARTILLHLARRGSLRVLMVTSALKGEGKTSLAGLLAASLARAGRKTLLLDCDLRNPTVHQLFFQPIGPGFGELLGGEVQITSVIHRTSLRRLWLIPAGKWDSQALQALAQDDVRTIFEQLKKAFDFIVVDSCPVLPVAESLLIGRHVDAALFSILCSVSRVPTVSAARQRLQMLGIPVVGAVVQGARGDFFGSGYRPALSPANPQPTGR
jgi:capsular exopolysaccharide synthesis family protein